MARVLPGLQWLVFVFVAVYTTAAQKNNTQHESPFFDEITTESTEARLVNALLTNHQRWGGKINRPVLNSTSKVIVFFGLRLVNLDIDAKNQELKTSVWVRLRWVDERLRWRPEEYDDIAHVILPVTELWKPDVALVNTGESETGEKGADMQLKHNGRVFWAPHREYKSACLIDVTEYPYDQHTCQMWFQCISSYSWHVDLQEYDKAPLDLDTYIDSFKNAQEWEIIKNETKRFEQSRDAGVMLMYSRRVAIRFTLTLKRRPSFKGMLLLLPCLLLSLMIPLIFCFPPERPDRHTLAMSLFASLMILLLMVNDAAPPTAASVPKLAIYYSMNVIVLIFATTVSVGVVNLNKRAETKAAVPNWAKKVFINFLGRLLCMHPDEPPSETTYVSAGQGRAPTSVNSLNSQTPSPTEAFTTVHNGHNTSPDSMNDLNNKLDCIITHLGAAKDGRQAAVSSPNLASENNLNQKSWKTLALVLDRMSFFLFLLVDIILVFIFYPKDK